MEFQNEERVNFIETLSTLINDATALVDGFLSELGWTRERILDVRAFIHKLFRLNPSLLHSLLLI